MLILGHLVIGLILGFILCERFQDKNIILFCAIGSVLPDLMDKPLGYILFSSTLSNGKIFFHSLLIVVLFFIAGIAVWHWYRSRAFIGVAMGILCHQIVDGMWMYSQGWFYPFCGPFQTQPARSEYIHQVYLTETSSATEWVFLVALITILIIFIVNRVRRKSLLEYDPLLSAQRRELATGLVGVGLFVLTLAIIIIWLVEPISIGV
jgi:membrane-bound metal-dependent hydrolase YbcI (DUF457 family)